MSTKEQHVEEKDILIQISKKELVAMVDTYKQVSFNHSFQGWVAVSVAFIFAYNIASVE